MMRVSAVLFNRNWANASRTRSYLFKPTTPSLVAVDNVLKSYFSVNSTNSSLRTYLNVLKNSKYIQKIDLNEILTLLRRDQLTDVDAIEVLECCRSKHVQQTHVLDDIWTELKSKTVPLNLQHYNALLRIYIEKERIFSPSAMLDEMIERGMKPNVLTCNLLISSCTLQGDVNGAMNVLEYLQKHKIVINESIFNNLILAFANNGDTNGMNQIFMAMKANELRADYNTLENLLKGYAKIGDSGSLKAIFELFKTENIELLNFDILNVITELDKNGHRDKIEEFYDRLFKSIEYRYSAKAFIERSVQGRRFEIIEKLLTHNADRCSLVSLAQHYLAEAVGASCTEQEINRIWHHLETLNVTINSNIGAYFPVALRSSSASLVRATLDGMKTQGLSIRDEHFKHLCHLESTKSPDAVLDVMRLMRFDFNVRPRCSLIRDTFLPLYGSDERPPIVLSKLITLDLCITTILTAVITRYLLDKRLGDAVKIANMYKNHYFMARQYRPFLIQAIQGTDDLDNFVKFVRILRDDVERLRETAKIISTTNESTKEQILEQVYFGNDEMDETQIVGEIIHDAIVSIKGDSEKIEKLLERMLSEGLQISKDFAVKIQWKLNVNPETSLSSLLNQLSASKLVPQAILKTPYFISPLKFLSSDELIILIDLAENRGRTVAGYKRLLFQAYISENNLLAAEELLHDSDIGHSKKIYSDLITLCINQKDIDKALNYFEQAQTHDQNIFLHPIHAMRIVAMLLFSGHKYDEIQQTMRAMGVTYSFVTRKIPLAAIDLLRIAGESGDVNLTRELFDHLKKTDCIKPNVKSTAALVNVHLQNGNVIDAFNAFEQIYENNRCTPIKLNLLSKLIEQDDMNRLQKLFDIVATEHGEHIAMRTLAYAFIDAGQIEQATIVLSKHILVQRPHFLRRDCNYLHRRGHINILKGLLKATNKLDYDRTDIYRCLFIHYCNTSQSQHETGHQIRENIQPVDFLIEMNALLGLEMTESITDVEKFENMIAESTPILVDSGNGEQQIDEKLRHMMSLDTEHMSEATDIILTALKSNVKINPKILSQYLSQAAEIGDTIAYDELWNYSEVRNLPNFSTFYLQAYQNGTNRIRYIQKLQKLIENASSGINSAHHEQHDEINKLVCIEGDLRFLQEHPHVINEYETMAIKVTKLNVYAPINVVWLYHLISESPFIESLWLQHFVTQPEHFQTNAMLRILDAEKCHTKLKKFTDFLVTNDRLADATSVQNARLRIYLDANRFVDAINLLETSSIPLKFVDRKILDELKQCSGANGITFPMSIE